MIINCFKNTNRKFNSDTIIIQSEHCRMAVVRYANVLCGRKHRNKFLIFDEMAMIITLFNKTAFLHM